MAVHYRCLLVVATLLLPLALLGAGEEDLLLYLPYDGSADAAVARGDGTATTAIEPEFRPGVSGQALLIGGQPEENQEIINGIPVVKEAGRNAYYAHEGNIDFDNGSLSLWMKPLDWDYDTKGFNVVFLTNAGKQYFMLYKFFSNPRFQFIRGPAQGFTVARFDMHPFTPGQWQHITLTWTPDIIRYYVNGRLVNTQKVRDKSDEKTPLLPISVGPGNHWEKAFVGHTLVDELRIHSRSLTQEEIVALYREHADQTQRDVGLVTIGERTPQVNGDVEPWEYSFAGTGWMDVRDGQASLPQPLYHLSYDADNLYLGIQSAWLPEELEAVLLVQQPNGETREWVFPLGQVSAPSREALEAGNWQLEAVIALSELGLDGRGAGRFNVGLRSPNLTLSVAPAVGDLTDSSNFLKLILQPDAPALRIAGLFDMVNHISASDFSARGQGDERLQLVYTSDTGHEHGKQTVTRMLFEDGQSTPFKAPEPPREPWSLLAFAINDIQIRALGEDGNQTLYENRIIYSEALPLRHHYLYVQDKSQLFIAASSFQAGTLRLRFEDADGATVWSVETPVSGNGYAEHTFPLDYSELPPDDYMIRVEHVSENDGVTEAWWQDLGIPAVDTKILQPYTDREADVVPAPWTPLEMSGGTVSMWGRTYDFSGGLLYQSLTSQDHQVSAGPAVLRLDGQVLEVPTGLPVLTSASDMAVSFRKTAEFGALRASSELTTHFDGYCEIELTLAPAGDGVMIPSLSLDIPLHSEHATLVRDGQISPLGGSKAGAVGEYWHQRLADHPFFWVGDERAGFNWLAKDLEAWHFRDMEKNVEILREGDTAIVRLNLVDHPLELNGPRTFRFGFCLTPSRPIDREVHRARIGKDWGQWCQPWEYFAVLDYETADREHVAWKARDVDELYIYQGDGLTSPFSPEWTFWEEEWRDMRPSHGYGTYSGKPESRPRTGYTSGCLNSDTFVNYIQHMRADFYEQAKTPLHPKAINYYFDSGIGATACTNAHHGCSHWIDANGREHGRMYIDEMREIQLNVYRMIKRTGPEAKVMIHQGWVRSSPINHFTDTSIGGEGVTSLVKTVGYYGFITPEMFRATWLPQIWGVKTAWLNMLVRAAAYSPEKLVNFATDPEAQRATRHFYGYCVVHDVDWWDEHPETAEVREAVWAAQDVMGWDVDVRFHGYWEEDSPVQQVAPGSSRVLASAYTNNGRMMLAVLNDTDEAQEVELALDLEALGVLAGLTGSDVFAPDKNWTLAPTWQGTIPARGFVLIPFQDED